MKDIATENFQQIYKAYEILSDLNKRQIYDIYSMEGLTSGLELGPKHNGVEEIKAELRGYCSVHHSFCLFISIQYE
ncbi:hypothetical protein GYH30_050540 [Glycine max]|uniref:J domain-containing protein n=1 Tax=Glycine max TaxID=3847 RepID=K7MTG3_SOYBN|nr:hypothetical protein GYH30_050540 [Glycine max]